MKTCPHCDQPRTEDLTQLGLADGAAAYADEDLEIAEQTFRLVSEDLAATQPPLPDTRIETGPGDSQVPTGAVRSVDRRI